MRVYELTPPGGFEWALPIDSSVFETFLALEGAPRRDWDAPVMHRLTLDEDGRALRRSDFPWLGTHVLVLGGAAVAALGAYLEPYGQLLELAGGDGDLRLFNATVVIEALDQERSEIVRFDDGEVLAIERHVFRPEIIGDVEVFKVPGRASSIFVTEAFVARVRETGLVGIAFDLLWSDEPDAVQNEIVRICGA